MFVVSGNPLNLTILCVRACISKLCGLKQTKSSVHDFTSYPLKYSVASDPTGEYSWI
jgi:hypothetical protein